MSEPVTPHSIDAERAVLGALMVDGSRLLDIAETLRVEDFFRAAHQQIYAVMHDLFQRGDAIDPLTVAARLDRLGQLEACDGPAYLTALTDGMPASANIEAYARIVRDHADRARLMKAAHKILADVKNSDADAREQIERAERLIFSVAQHRTGRDFIDAAALVADGIPAIDTLLERKTSLVGVPSGFVDLDAMTRGWQPGSLIFIAARPSIGKTAFAINAAYHAATHGVPVAFFSLEMSRLELFMRLVASVGRIDGHRLQSGYLNQTDYRTMSNAFVQIGESLLSICDEPNLGALEMRGKLRRLKARQALGLVVLDYLQLMQTGRAENRNLAIADISRSLKLMAREFNVPVVVLSQLSREVEKRAEKLPMLSDLRDSGALEQDADVVLFIHRPEVYKPKPDNAGLAEIVIAKQRNGPTGVVRLYWSKSETRFENRTGAYA